MAHHPEPAGPDDRAGTAMLVLVGDQRAACGEVARCATAVGSLAEHGGSIGPAHRGALGAVVTRLCRDTRRYHLAQEIHLWPLLEQWAPGRADLAGLGNDHTELFSCLDEVHRALPHGLAALGTASAGRSWTEGRAAHRLASGMRHLAELLDEHTAEEERELAALIGTAPPADGWQSVESLLAASGGRSEDRFRRPAPVPRGDVAALDTVARGLRRVALSVRGARDRRRERLAFATTDGAGHGRRAAGS